MRNSGPTPGATCTPHSPSHDWVAEEKRKNGEWSKGRIKGKGRKVNVNFIGVSSVCRACALRLRKWPRCWVACVCVCIARVRVLRDGASYSIFGFSNCILFMFAIKSNYIYNQEGLNECVHYKWVDVWYCNFVNVRKIRYYIVFNIKKILFLFHCVGLVGKQRKKNRKKRIRERKRVKDKMHIHVESTQTKERTTNNNPRPIIFPSSFPPLPPFLCVNHDETATESSLFRVSISLLLSLTF